jgi:hypothetical protein
MNARDFRRIALSLQGAEESSHMGQPDFRVGGRIFATLASQHLGYGNLMLTLEQQQQFVDEMPGVFLPIQGGWGRRGMTHICLAHRRCVGRRLTCRVETAPGEKCKASQEVSRPGERESRKNLSSQIALNSIQNAATCERLPHPKSPPPQFSFLQPARLAFYSTLVPHLASG